MAAAEESELVFVYGTLLRGFGNHAVYLCGVAECLGAYETALPYALFVADYPYVHPRLARTRVLGELYRVPPAAMPALDALEEHPDFYRRERIAVVRRGADRAGGDPLLCGCAEPDEVAAPQHAEAWIYFNEFISDLPESRLPATLVPSGNFRDAPWTPPPE